MRLDFRVLLTLYVVAAASLRAPDDLCLFVLHVGLPCVLPARCMCRCRCISTATACSSSSTGAMAPCWTRLRISGCLETGPNQPTRNSADDGKQDVPR